MADATFGLHELTARIVSAHVGHHNVAPDALPGLIAQVYQALGKLGSEPETPAEAERPPPAVPIKRSVFADYIVCLEDGKKLKMLKRHLHTAYGLTPAQYRQRWGLPADYPMTAPAYAEKRSTLARQIGLGRKAPEPQAPAPKSRSRKGAVSATSPETAEE